MRDAEIWDGHNQIYWAWTTDQRADESSRSRRDVREWGWQQHRRQRKTVPDRATDFERIWQHGLSECLPWRLTEERYRAALTDFVVVEGYGKVPARLRIASRLQSHFAFLTYAVAGHFALENDLDAEARHEIWRFCWGRLNRLLLEHPTMPEWLIEIVLEAKVKEYVESQPERIEPIKPELETPLATQLLKAGREWDIAAHKIEAYSKDESIGERGIAAAIGKSKTTVHNALDRIERRARRIGAMP